MKLNHPAFRLAVLLLAAAIVPLSAQNLLLNGDFESGNTAFESDYTHSPSDIWTAKTYALLQSPSQAHPVAPSFPDHTTGAGRMLVVNGGPSALDRVWSQTVPVLPGREYAFSGWAANWGSTFPSAFVLFVNGHPISKPQRLPSQTGAWIHFAASWASAEAISATLEIRLTTTSSDGNDAAFDDLQFTLLPSERQLGAQIPAGLIAWWRGDAIPLDTAGAHHGTLYYGADFAPGILRQAFHFDGLDDAIQIADSPAFFLRSFTLQAWIFPESYGGPQNGVGWAQIFFRGDDRSALDSIFLALRQDGLLHFQIAESGGATQTLTAAVPLQTWTHLTAVLDDQASEMRLYLNGELQASGFTSVRPVLRLDPNIPGGIAIGNHAGAPRTGYNMPFHGLIDELRLFNRPLAGHEISAYVHGGDSPLLRIQPADSHIQISWTTPRTNWLLQTSTTLQPPSWSPVTAAPFLDQSRWTLLAPTSTPAAFYRLILAP